MKEYADFLIKDRDDISDAEIELDKKVISTYRIAEPLKSCPRCQQEMKIINYAYDSNIILDRCPACDGIWTEEGEIEKVAVYRKGNPELDVLCHAILEEKKELDRWKTFDETGQPLKTSAVLRIFLPKIFLPLGDDLATNIFPKATFALIIANLMIFLCQWLFVQETTLYFQTFGLVPSAIVSGKGILTLLSSMFLHKGLFHLLGNMLFLWVFADNVEEAFGHTRFLALYLVFGFSASFLHILTNMHSNIPSIGASGAVAGVMGAYFALYPHAKIKTLLIHQVVEVPAYLYLGGWIVMQVFSGMVLYSQKVHSTIGFFAHMGGFASGLILAGLFKRSGNTKSAYNNKSVRPRR
jgi:membrane associated rhomboid family serine protease